MRRLYFALSFTLLAACATSYVPRTSSRDELARYVDRAAQIVAREGTASCAEFGQPAWKSGQWYIFVNDIEKHTAVCHPARPDLVGQNVFDIRDTNGKYLTREMESAVAGAGSGWVEYVWPRPGQTTSEPKTAYVVAVTGPDGRRYLVGSGGYNMNSP
jgi:hypothetical protein